MKYISKSAPTLSGLHAAIDSNRKLFSASIMQLQSIVLFNNPYRWLGICIGIILCVDQTILLKLGKLAKQFHVLHLIWKVLHQFCYNSNQIYNYLLLFAYPAESIMHWHS